MQAFCCCSSRRRGRLSGGVGGDRTASPLPVSSPAGLATSRFDWNARQTQHPPAQADDVSASAQVSPCEGPVELCQLVADNDSDSHDDTSQSAKRSTGTLEVVRSRLIRHMPQDNEMRRQSRLAAGHSEEELARRAELRRFRQQRIQDELEKEKSNDEESQASHRSTRYLSPLIQLGQSGIGPRDTIEFTVDDSIAQPDDQVLTQQQDLDESSQGRSSHDVSESGRENTSSSFRGLPCNQGAEKSCVTGGPSPPPTAPNGSSPERLAGCSSNTAPGVDNDFDICRGSHAWDDQSALDVWLIAQGIRSRDCSLVRLGDAESERADGFERLHPLPDNFGRLDTAIYVRDTPRRTSFSQSLPWDEDYGNHTPLPGPSRCGEITSSDIGHPTCEDHDIGTEIPPTVRGRGSAVRQPLYDASSNYPSALPSFQPSLDDSGNNNYSLSPQDIESLHLSPIHCKMGSLFMTGQTSANLPGHEKLPALQDFGHSEGQSSYATAEEEDASSARRETTTAMSPRVTSQAESEGNSTAHSETGSFHQREAELQTIEQRFGDVISRKQADIPLHSRFREEFPGSTIQAPAKMSLVTKLHNSIFRLSRAGSEALSSMENRHFSTSLSLEVKPGPRSSPHCDEQRIPGAYPKSNEVGTLSAHTLSSIESRSWGDSNLRGRSSSDAFKATAGRVLLDQSSFPSPLIVQSWEIDKQGAPCDELKGIGTVPAVAGSRCQTMPPESWAKYPSHRRDGGAHIALSKESPLPVAFLDMGDSQREGDIVTRSPSSEHEPSRLPKRLEKAVRNGIGRLLPSKTMLGHEAARAASQDDRSQGKKLLSLDEVPATLGESRHDASTAKNPPLTSTRYPRQALHQEQCAVSAAQGPTLHSKSHASSCGKAKQIGKEFEPSIGGFELPRPQASAERPRASTFPLSRFQLDATVDASTHTLDDCQSRHDGIGATLRRWKSTGGHNRRKRRTSIQTCRLKNQSLMTGGSLIFDEGLQRRNSGEILVLH